MILFIWMALFPPHLYNLVLIPYLSEQRLLMASGHCLKHEVSILLKAATMVCSILGQGTTGNTQWAESVYLSDATSLNIASKYYLLGTRENFSELTPGSPYHSDKIQFTIP